MMPGTAERTKPAFPPVPEAELCLYRERTILLLRRYFRMSLEVGRLPSLLGRECFRAHLTSYRAPTFEDAVILVHDVERCLEELEEFSHDLIVRIVLQDYSQAEAACLLGCTRRTVVRRYPEALDELSRIVLQRGLLRPLGPPEDNRCQAPADAAELVTAYVDEE